MRTIKLALLRIIMATSVYQKRFIERRKEQGLCLKCGKPLDRDGTYCKECRKIITAESTQRRNWYQSNGICPRCGKNNLFGQEKVCIECNAKAYEITMQSRERLGSEHYNNQHAEWARNEHHRRIEQGICTRCGKRKADGGYKTCGICREKIRNQKRIKYGYGESNRNDRLEKGICYFCDNPVKEGYKVCEKHYQMNIDKLNSENCKKNREKLKTQNKIYFMKG